MQLLISGLQSTTVSLSFEGKFIEPVRLVLTYNQERPTERVSPAVFVATWLSPISGWRCQEVRDHADMIHLHCRQKLIVAAAAGQGSGASLRLELELLSCGEIKKCSHDKALNFLPASPNKVLHSDYAYIP